MNTYFPPDAYQGLNQDISQILLTAEAIQQRVREVGQVISDDYKGCNPLLIGVLKGVVPFMADLLRAITIPLEVDYMAISTYSTETRHRGYVRLEKDVEESLGGRHVIFVEDVIDTGLTLNYLLNSIRVHQPATLEVCVCFNKPDRRLIDIPLKYKGFDLPSKFVVGYGLDYREKYRNLPFVGLLKPAIFAPT